MHHKLSNLAQKNATEIVETIAALTGPVTSLDLSGNYLGTKTAAELVQILTALPATLTSLDLSGNRLDL